MDLSNFSNLICSPEKKVLPLKKFHEINPYGDLFTNVQKRAKYNELRTKKRSSLIQNDRNNDLINIITKNSSK
jgi:hypothetical protein